MEFSLTTPALLFPAVSLLLLAYTNRFLALAALIRSLHSQYRDEPKAHLVEQIRSLRHRVMLIRNMQMLGVSGILGCTLSMFVLFAGWTNAGRIIFGASLVLLIGSLVLSVREIQISVIALNLQLSDMEIEYSKSKK